MSGLEVCKKKKNTSGCLNHEYFSPGYCHFRMEAFKIFTWTSVIIIIKQTNGIDYNFKTRIENVHILIAFLNEKKSNLIKLVNVT